MDNLSHPGGLLLQQWRKASKVSQEALGDMVVPRVTQAAVSRWEDGSSQRPSLATACQLQRITDIPATEWGYSREEVDAVLGLARAMSLDVATPPVQEVA